MKQLAIGICMILFVFLLSSCGQKTPADAGTYLPDTKLGSISDENIKAEDLENPQVAEETDHYKILLGDNNTSYYYLYDNNKKIVAEGGFYWKVPQISMVNDTLVKFRRQTGTGISTSQTFYYDTEKDIISNTFYSVYDETDELLVLSDHEKIVVRNIFDETAYYHEFTQFNNISDVVEPFINAEFVENGKQIKVIYYMTGDDFKEAMEFVELP